MATVDLMQEAQEASEAAAAAAAAGVAQSQATSPLPGSPSDPHRHPPAPTGGADLPPSLQGVDGAYRWLVAWLIVILLFIVAARTRLGYTLLYYALSLILLFLLVTNYAWIAAALAPITDKQGSLLQ